MFITYIYNCLTSNDHVERNFAYLILFLFSNSLLYIFINPFFGAYICTLKSIIILILIYTIYKFEYYKFISEFCRFLIYILLMFVSLSFYMGNNYIQKQKFDKIGESYLWDNYLLQLDTALFGSFFPKGQLSLYLDNYTDTLALKIISELLQFTYVSYYFFGNILAFYFLCLYLYQSYHKNKLKQRLIYRIILIFCTAWVSSFLVTYCLNLIFPAVSPRIYLQKEYKTEIKGLLLTEWFRNGINNMAINTFGAFPSAHCGVSFIVPIICHRLNLHLYKWITFIFAILIFISTIVLRYHYFVDFLGSFMVIFICTLFGGLHSEKNFKNLLELKTLGLQNIDMKIFYNNNTLNNINSIDV